MPATSSAEDSYQAANFSVEIDGFANVRVSRIRGLRRRTSVIVVREGGDPGAGRSSPGLTRIAPIILERPRTNDDTFERWADLVATRTAGGRDFRRSMAIVLLLPDGTPGIQYNVFDCWPSRYEAVDELDALSSQAVMERLVVQHQGWESLRL
ncbi:phage tail protein [Paludisphaera mucosa]|uniref:Phage tail protein n=1 Tax=Paludisphaera mucosa TaxID=3030827 RepID=A0ABT6F752_9BACT|nr:phage tail protein [Paludisphaera mucosa]